MEVNFNPSNRDFSYAYYILLFASITKGKIARQSLPSCFFRQKGLN